MKMIVAIIRPEKVKNVKDALKDAGIIGLTLYPVKGRGAQGGMNFMTRTGTFCIDELEKIMLNIAVEDDRTQLVSDAIKESASTGSAGDGWIYVLPIEETIKISGGAADN